MARWKLALGIVGSAAAVLGVLAIVDWGRLGAAVAGLSLPVVAGAALASAAMIAILSFRWVVLTAPADAPRRRGAFRDALVGQAFNIFTPAAIGGDVYRVAVAGPESGGRPRATGLVLFERLIGLAAYGLAYLACFLWLWTGGQVPPVFGLAALFFAGFCFLPLVAMAVARLRFLAAGAAGWRQWVADAGRAISSVTPFRLLIAIGLSLAGVGAWLACLGLLAEGASLDLGPAEIGMAAIVTELSRLLPISIQGIGVREATFAWLAVLLGAGAEAAVITCATAYALHFLLVALLALGDRLIVGAGLARRQRSGA